MFLKIILFIVLFFIIRKLLQVGFFVYTVKKQMDQAQKRTQNNSNQTKNTNSNDVIDAEFRVISEEK